MVRAVKRIEKGEREGVRWEGVGREGVRREVVRREDKEVREEGKGATEEKTGAASGSHTAEPVQIPDCSIYMCRKKNNNTQQ